MAINRENYLSISAELAQGDITLVAVTKKKPVEDILGLYELGHRDFGENYVQELLEKQSRLPGDIRWHFIGHLQGNKVKYIAPFIHLIHGVDSLKLLYEINRQAEKQRRRISVLFQVHIAREETKFGLDAGELGRILDTVSRPGELLHIAPRGLMGMASFTDDEKLMQSEFRYLHSLFVQYRDQFPPDGAWDILSMGMSQDYRIAVREGANMVRIGSLIFGERDI